MVGLRNAQMRPKGTKAEAEKACKLEIRNQKEPLATQSTSSIWFFLPKEFQVPVDLTKIEFPPPVVPRFPQATMPMLPAGVIINMAHNWEDSGHWVRFSHTTAGSLMEQYGFHIFISQVPYH
jgi:hypothetical protein